MLTHQFRIRSGLETEQVADISIRRLLDGDGNVAFFISIPPSESVIVNGNTYSNPQSSVQNLFIGPLNGFTTIQLLGLPLLFWKTRADLEHRPGPGRPKKVPQSTNVALELHEGTLQLLGADVDEDDVAGMIDDQDAPPGPDDTMESRDAKKLDDEGDVPMPEDFGQEEGRTGNRGMPVTEHSATKTPDIPADFRPCDYLPSELRTLKAQGNVTKWLKQERYRRERRDRTGQSFSEYELLTVLHSINSVAQAITDMRSNDQGYSIVRPGDIRWMHDPVNGEEPSEPIRPGRPLLVPWMADTHMVLLTAQYDVS
jgi:hypothetical protein